MTHLTYRNGVSIAEIIVYVPALFISIFLAVKHGFGRSSGWYFLIIFTLARLIGPAMQLATINDPNNISLYIGSSVLNNVGLSPLELAAIGLLSRLLDHIHRSHTTILNTRMLKFIEVIILVGLILGIVGGIDAGNNYENTGKFTPTSLNKAGTILFIISWIGLAGATILMSFSLPHAEHGEKRLFFAVAAAIPLLLVRLVYSIGSTFTHGKEFNLLTGNVTVFLCVALIEEFMVVCIFLGVGLTLKKVEKIQYVEAAQVHNQDGTFSAPAQPKKENLALRIAKKTIIGRIVMAFIPEKDENKGYEMHHQQQGHQQGGYVQN